MLIQEKCNLLQYNSTKACLISIFLQNRSVFTKIKKIEH